jgi:hypothetical protein
MALLFAVSRGGRLPDTVISARISTTRWGERRWQRSTIGEWDPAWLTSFGAALTRGALTSTAPGPTPIVRSGSWPLATAAVLLRPPVATAAQELVDFLFEDRLQHRAQG